MALLNVALAVVPVILICFSGTSNSSDNVQAIWNWETQGELQNSASGWEGVEKIVGYTKPSDFNPKLSFLDGSTEVWVEINTTNNFSHKFPRLATEYCNVIIARISIKYHAGLATAFFHPCGDTTGCYLPTSADTWEVANFIINVGKLDEVRIEGIVLSPDGYIMFDSIKITYTGSSCTPTTTIPTTETTPPSPPTTSEQTDETEATDGSTWGPTITTTLTTTTPAPSTTTTETMPPGETEATDEPTTKIPTTETPTTETPTTETPTTETPTTETPTTETPTTETPTTETPTTETPTTETPTTETPTTETPTTETPTTETPTTETPTTETPTTETPTTETPTTETPTTEPPTTETPTTETPTTETPTTETPTTETPTTETPTTETPTTETPTTETPTTETPTTETPTTETPTTETPTTETPSTETPTTESETTWSTPSETTDSSVSTPFQPPTTRSPATSRIPIVPTSTSREEDEGLTWQQILLYIVLPVSVGVLLFLGTTFYCCCRGHSLAGLKNHGISKSALQGHSDTSGLPHNNPQSKPPPFHKNLKPSVPPSIQEPASSYVPQRNYVSPSGGVNYASPPVNSPAPAYTYFSPAYNNPPGGHSVALDIPNDNDPFDRSNRSSFNSRASGQPILYTGQYQQDLSNYLPRMKRKMN